MLNASSIIINFDPLYYYRLNNQNSITKNLTSKTFDVFKVIDKIEELLRKSNLYEVYKYALFQHKYKQFANLFLKTEPGLREKFYTEMKNRLNIYRYENLDPKICEKLMYYGMYKNILRLNSEEFYEKYNGKIKDTI